MLETTSRSSLSVMLSVWRALYLREALSRVSATRTAWVWLLLEPVMHIAFLMFVFEVVRVRVIGGIDTAMWLMVGMTTFFMFRRPAVQAMNGLKSNSALFIYRQVRPVDVVIVRAGLEGGLMIIVTLIMFIGAYYFGEDVIPANPLGSVMAFFGLWLVALGFGLITSVVSSLVVELGNIVTLMLTPLYLFSGVIFPISKVPEPYQYWLMYNPIAHGIEAARLSFSPLYQAVPGVSILYIYSFGVVMLFLGLALHVRYSTRLLSQ